MLSFSVSCAIAFADLNTSGMVVVPIVPKDGIWVRRSSNMFKALNINRVCSVDCAIAVPEARDRVPLRIGVSVIRLSSVDPVGASARDDRPGGDVRSRVSITVLDLVMDAPPARSLARSGRA
jgi:hypothetical protein